MTTTRSSRRCPHVTAGISLDGWQDRYKYHNNKFGSCKKCKVNCTTICLKCGEKYCESVFEIKHASCHTCHQLALRMHTMEVWCFKCKKSPKNSDKINKALSQLESIKYFKQLAKFLPAQPSLVAATPLKKRLVQQYQPHAVKDQRSITKQSTSNGSHLYENKSVVKKATSAQIAHTAQQNFVFPKGSNQPYSRNRLTKNIGQFQCGGSQTTTSRRPTSMLSKNQEKRSPYKFLTKKNEETVAQFSSMQESPNNNGHTHRHPVSHHGYQPTANRQVTNKLCLQNSRPSHPYNHGERLQEHRLFDVASQKKKLTKTKTSNGITNTSKQHTPAAPTVKDKLKDSRIVERIIERSLQMSRSSECRPVKGLQNVGNTCFFNAVLQVLYQTNCLHHYLNSAIKYPQNVKVYGTERIIDITITTTPGPVTNALNRFLKEMDASNKVVNPAPLLNSLANKHKRYRLFDQQDSHEVFRCLLDAVKMEEIKRLKKSIDGATTDSRYVSLIKKHKTVVDDVFGGCLCSTIICRECLTPIQLLESFFDVSLSINKPKRPFLGSKKSEVEDPHKIRAFLQKRNLLHHLEGFKQDYSHHSLEAYLGHFTTLEVLDDDNKFICEACTASNKANNVLKTSSRSSLDGLALCPVSKLLLIHDLPKVLVLHLKRFKLGIVVTKNNQHVQFPFELNIAPFCTNHCQKYLDSNQRILYSLYGVVVHHGTLHGGHYTAFVKAAALHDTKWFYVSDSYFRSASTEEVQSSNAYMLFYKMSPNYVI
ncbi:ubiquitin carboxyl-terminal hydrolase 45-like isoform X2 [Dysidea avara]|uniref:ubiquitin carboxyl-terminal hydrolase 45-like isoform X2 n=1 Tax=Dysidea avara TaxID=196820 RepID=UPI0033322C21